MALDREAIRRRLEAATPGPWEYQGLGEITSATGFITTDAEAHDGPFIAHAREDVPALLAEVERLRDGIEELAALHSPGIVQDELRSLLT